MLEVIGESESSPNGVHLILEINPQFVSTLQWYTLTT